MQLTPPPFPHSTQLQDAVAQRAEYWRAEDDLIEQAAKLLTSKVRRLPTPLTSDNRPTHTNQLPHPRQQ